MSVCRSCEAEIEWAQTDAGKMMPLDAKPTDDGTFVLIGGKTRKANQGDLELRRPLHTSHFATCPNAAQHRKPRPPHG